MSNRRRLRRNLVLKPAVLFGLVWLSLGFFWLTTTDESYRLITGSSKHFTVRGLLLTTLSVLAFLIGSHLSTRWGRTPPSVRAPIRGQLSAVLSSDAGFRLVLWATFLPIAASGVLVFFVLIRSGSPGALAASISDGNSLSSVTGAVFSSGSLSKLEAIVHLFPVSAAMLAASSIFAPTYRRRLRRRLVLLSLLCSLTISFLASDRLVFYEHIFAFGASIALSLHMVQRRLFSRRRLAALAAGGFIVLTLWSVAEYARGYTSRFSAASSGTPAPLAFAQQRLGSYYLTSFNNLQVVLGGESPLSAPTRALPITSTLVNVFPAQNDAAGERQLDVLRSLYTEENRLTTFSLLGYFYLDVGSVVLVPALFLMGVGAGSIYRRSRTSVAAFLAYPLVVVAILDSPRINYIFGTQGVIGLLAAFVLGRSFDRIMRGRTTARSS